MYQVYSDEYLIYDENVPGLKILNPKLDLELNKAGSFSFTIYPNHPYANRVKKMESIITVKQNGDIIFRGRILNDETGFKNERQVTCEGELAFLIDSIQRPYEYTGDIPGLFTQFITAHNAQVETKKQFKVGNITVTDPNNYINRSDTQYLSTYDSISKKLIDTHGGYLYFRHEDDGVYIDYLEDFETLNSQDIRLRKNILDITDTAKGEEIYTVLIPLGAKQTMSEDDDDDGNDDGTETQADETGTEEGGTTTTTDEAPRLTIESVNNGLDYIYDQDAVDRFGWITKTQTWDDVTLPENLLSKAQETLANAFQFDRSLEISAVDLSGTDTSIASFRIGMYNNVYSDVHDLDERLLVTKMSLNLTNPSGDKLTLGKSFKSLTDQNKDNSDKIGDVVERIESITSDYEINIPNLIESYIQNLRQELISAITQESDSIRLEVSENYYLKDETDQLIESQSTSLEQTKNEFLFKFDSFSKDISDLASSTNTKFTDISKYIRFVDGDIILGEVGNDLTLKISHDKISFLQNNAEVAYFTDRKLYVTDGEYTKTLTIGNFAFTPRANGNTAFVKIK